MGSEAETVLEVRNLVKRFSGLVAVSDLSFQVKKRRIHALIGPNGAGKTTTVNMITGDGPQTEGDVLLFGESISRLPVYMRAQRGIGRTFQNIKLFSTMTVLENLMIGAQYNTNQNLLSYLVNVVRYRHEPLPGRGGKQSGVWTAEDDRAGADPDDGTQADPAG